MVKNEWTQVSIETAKNHMGKKLKNFQDSPSQGTRPTPENVLGFFLERSGMLRQPIEEELDFAHRTFQEYMAAQAAIDEGDVGVLAGHATNPQWREVIVLGAGLARPAERRDLIVELIKKGDQSTNEQYQLHLLAAACLDTSVEVDSDVKKQVEDRVRRLIPPSRMPEAALLADAAGEVAVPFLKRSRYFLALQAAACVRALGLIGSLEALQAIADYATDHRISVLREVVRAAERFETDLYSRWVGEQLNATDLSPKLVGRLIDLGVKGIKRLSSLTILELRSATQATLAVLRELSKLRILYLSGNFIDLSPIQHLSNLEELMVSSVQLSDLSALQGLTKLKELHIWADSVRDITPLKSLSNLRTLSLSSNEVGDISALKGLHNIEQLLLRGTQASDLSALAGMPNLRVLDLMNTPSRTSQRSRSLRQTRVTRPVSLGGHQPLAAWGSYIAHGDRPPFDWCQARASTVAAAEASQSQDRG